MKRLILAAWQHLSNLVKPPGDRIAKLRWSNLVASARARRGEVTVKDGHLYNHHGRASKQERKVRRKLISDIYDKVPEAVARGIFIEETIQPVAWVRRLREKPIFSTNTHEAILRLAKHKTMVLSLTITTDLGATTKCAVTPAKDAVYLYYPALATTDGTQALWVPIHHVMWPNCDVAVLIALKRGLLARPSVS